MCSGGDHSGEETRALTFLPVPGHADKSLTNRKLSRPD
jgi:hypothetical protein